MTNDVLDELSRKVQESPYMSIWKSRFDTIWVSGELTVLEYLLCLLLFVNVERCY